MKNPEPTPVARPHRTLSTKSLFRLPRPWISLTVALASVTALRAADEIDQVTRELQERLAQAESEFSLGLLLVWLVVGALVGTLAGMLFARKRSGFGALANLLIGLCGAWLGGTLFNYLHLNFHWGAFVIHYQDLFSAFIGSILLLSLVSVIRRGKGSGASKSAKK